MSWSAFATIPFYFPGFKFGERDIYDENGVLKLESLNGRHVIPDGEGADMEDDMGEENFPYFRFALGGRRHAGDLQGTN